MSSWFRGAFESVKEKSTTLRQRVSQVRRGSTSVEAAIEALELRAAQVRNVQALVALYREWLASINEAEESLGQLMPNEQEGVRSLAPMFIETTPSDEAFGAAEISCTRGDPLFIGEGHFGWLATLIWTNVYLVKNWPPQTASPSVANGSTEVGSDSASESDVRVVKERTLEEAAADMEGEAAGLLFSLLSKLLDGDSEVWVPVVAHILSTSPEYLAASEPSEPAGAAASPSRTPAVEAFKKAKEGGDACVWSLNILSHCLKKDWNASWLASEMKRNGIEADYRRQELMVAMNKRPQDNDWDKWFDARLGQSENLVALWGRIRDHASSSIKCREAHEDIIASECDKMTKSAVASSQKAALMANGQRDTQARDASGLNCQEKRVEEQMNAMMTDRKEIDARIAALEAKKMKLRLELEKISEDLVEAQRQQVLCMQREDSVRKSLGDTRQSYQQSIRAAEEAENKYGRLQKRFDKIVELAGNSKRVVAETDEKMGVEMKKKLSQISQAYIGTCREHLRFIEDRMTNISENVKKLAQQKETLERGNTGMLAGYTSAAALTGFDSAITSSSVLNSYTARTSEATLDQIKQIRSQLAADYQRLSACRQAAIDFVQPLKVRVDVETFRLEGERIESLYRHAQVVLKHAGIEEGFKAEKVDQVVSNDQVLEETTSICLTPPEEPATPLADDNDGNATAKN
ncbi:hypothetical protein FOL47_007309 [Perkinsus chesapeaki]|uniref:Uncharacterized protein n=1 Tax=Perkinsus chesapeaki TaxID=330153 RepID=A0A7J6LLY9_PERCH|nr:hypothetical protein FOL47_007309 [Perkinsus chesapeaki]